MFNRRELLKMFGFGAVVAPMTATKAFMEVQERDEKPSPLLVTDPVVADPKRKYVKFRDGEGREIEFLVAEGSLTYKTDTEYDFQCERGVLERVRLGDSRTYIELDIQYERMTAPSKAVDLIREAAPGDLTLTYDEGDISTTFWNFSWATLEWDEGNGLLSISGTAQPNV